MKNTESYIRLKRTYGNVEAKNRNIVLALAFTESSLDYSVKHKNDIAKGICGVVPKFHQELLRESNTDINSLKACEIVYNYYLELNNGNKIKTIINYKGIKSKDNMYLVYKVLEIEKEIKNK